MDGLIGFVGDFLAARVLLVAAHPDDETIGAGGLLQRLNNATVVHVTDGCPLDPRLRSDPYHDAPVAYGSRRRREVLAALTIAAISNRRIVRLGLVDQEVANSMAALAVFLARLVRRTHARAIITHAYEGGHPDHDATAFAARGACELLSRSGAGAERPPSNSEALEAAATPALIEMTSYHLGGETLESARFLPNSNEADTQRLSLTPSERRKKRAMFDCFVSQRSVLAAFDPDADELFRPAPLYDFSVPPHPPPLHYERLGWSSHASFCRNVRRSQRQLAALSLAMD